MAGGLWPEPVWENQLGGITFRLGDGPAARFVKWAPRNCGLELQPEAERIRWAAPFTPVPRVLAEGEDDDGAWLVTSALPGTSAVDERWRRDPAVAVHAIGAGLRALHDALPVEGCPFDWSVAERLRRAQERRVHVDSPEDAGSAPPAELPPEPPIDRLVVCHGDACAPNTILDDKGRWTGHVDLGELGIADRWADLAVATWSTEWNYGPGWEDELLAAYGVEPDPVRTAFYRRLWDTT
jgi:kanamycin kinase